MGACSSVAPYTDAELAWAAPITCRLVAETDAMAAAVAKAAPGLCAADQPNTEAHVGVLQVMNSLRVVQAFLAKASKGDLPTEDELRNVQFIIDPRDSFAALYFEVAQVLVKKPARKAVANLEKRVQANHAIVLDVIKGVNAAMRSA